MRANAAAAAGSDDDGSNRQAIIELLKNPPPASEPTAAECKQMGNDAFARKDHGVFEDSLVWPDEIEPHGAELLLVTVMLDGDTTAPSLPSTTYVDRDVEDMIDEASLMGGSIPEHSSPVSRREFLALGVAAIEACAIAVLLCVVKTQARRTAPPVLRGKYV